MNNNIKNTNTNFELTPELKKLQNATTYFEKLKEMTLLGITSGKRPFANVLLLFLLNIFFLLIAGSLIAYKGFEYKYLLFFSIVITIGVIFVLLGVKRMLTLLQWDYYWYVFNQLEPFVRNICSAILDKVETNTNKIITPDQLKGVYSTFIQQIPSAFQKGFWFLLVQVPVVGLVADIYRIPTLNTYEKRSDQLVAKLKQYLQNSIQEERRSPWLTKMFLLNIVLQIIVLYFLIH